MWNDISVLAVKSAESGLLRLPVRSSLRANRAPKLKPTDGNAWCSRRSPPARSFALFSTRWLLTSGPRTSRKRDAHRRFTTTELLWSTHHQCLRKSLPNRSRQRPGGTGLSTSISPYHGRRVQEATVRDAGRGAVAVDNAALLRRVAKYIEEDGAAADKLAMVMSEGAGRRLKSMLASMEYTVRQPTFGELRRVALTNAVPFVGFGFMDNAIMVVAGEYIDVTVGVALGISTMAAAALGNTISDVAGVGLGGAIDSLAARVGLPASKLSRAQMRLRVTRLASLVGNAIGVAIGCLLGMFPLLFMTDPDAVEAIKHREKIVGLIDAVVEEAASFLSATSATLFILERDTGVLWARRRGLPGTPNANAMQDLRLDLRDRGPVSRAARTGEAVSLLPGKDGTPASALCMPVFAADGQVAGVVQVLGKRIGDDARDAGFTAEDTKRLSALCSHISVALENIKRTDRNDEVDLRETIALMRSNGGANREVEFLEHPSTNTTWGTSPDTSSAKPSPKA